MPCLQHLCVANRVAGERQGRLNLPTGDSKLVENERRKTVHNYLIS